MIEVLTEDTRWDRLDLDALAQRAEAATLADAGLSPDRAEVALLACDDARIGALNAGFRGRTTPTNVLSWPAENLSAAADGGPPRLPAAAKDGCVHLGDIAIAWETCAREAAEQGKAMADHVCHLLVHGLLHLLGYDHVRQKDADLMEAAEVRILARLGLGDPYD